MTSSVREMSFFHIVCWIYQDSAISRINAVKGSIKRGTGFPAGGNICSILFCSHMEQNCSGPFSKDRKIEGNEKRKSCSRAGSFISYLLTFERVPSHLKHEVTIHSPIFHFFFTVSYLSPFNKVLTVRYL